MLRFFEAISRWRGKPELETVSISFYPHFFPSLPFSVPFPSVAARYRPIPAATARLVWTN